MPDASRKRDASRDLIAGACMLIRPSTDLLRVVRPTSLPSHLRPYRPFSTSPLNSSTTMSGFYNLKAQLPGNKEYDFDQLKGKVVLVVNVASQW